MAIPKTLDNFKIKLKDGTTYDMAVDLLILVRSFIIRSPKPIIYTEKIDGRNGSIRMGKDFDERTIKAVCSFFGVDKHDYSLLRNKLFQVLMQNDTFYLISDAEPGKRWLVEISDEWDPERVGYYGEFTLDFTSEQAYAESIGTTLDPLTFDSGLWQFGQGLIAEDLQYTHSTTTFSIYNAGDVAVDPRELPLVITYSGASTNLSITNNTNGNVWSYTGSSVAGDTITIDGVKSKKNTASIFSDTNKQLVTLEPGWNDFTLAGTSGSFTISFDFRFYTL